MYQITKCSVKEQNVLKIIGVLCEVSRLRTRAATAYTMTAALCDVPFTVGGLAKATFIGAASAAVTFGIGSAASSMFSTPAMGFWQGAYQGAIIGSITGAGGVVANAIFTGQSITLKAVLGGAAMGGLIGGAIGGIQAQNRLNKFSTACDKMGITPEDPVPATDEFLNESQKTWFPKAPMENTIDFTVDNVPSGTFDGYPKAYAMTNPQSIGGKLTGCSRVYFNKNLAFSSAKTLYNAMGHEFVHVSQYALLAGQARGILTDAFRDMMEHHAYKWQDSVGGALIHVGDFDGDVTQFGDWFNKMEYQNFSWTAFTKSLNK